MQFFWARFAGCSLFEEHCRRWCWNCRCWSLVPFVQPLWTKTSPLTHTSSLNAHVHIAPLTQLWVCQGKGGRQGFLWIRYFTWLSLYFSLALEADLQLCSWGVCTTVWLCSGAVGAEPWGEHPQSLCQDGSSVDLAAVGQFWALCPSPSSPPTVVLPPQAFAVEFLQ